MDKIIEAIKQTLKETPNDKLIGYALLTFSFFLALVYNLFEGKSSAAKGAHFVPCYIGLLALAGAYLIKNDKK